MSDVKRYDAVHLRYEESNIRYGEGCEVEVVTGYDYDRLEQECERIAAHRDSLSRVSDRVISERDAALKQVEGLRALMAEAVPALQHISDTAQDIESFTLAERFRSALQAKP